MLPNAGWVEMGAAYAYGNQIGKRPNKCQGKEEGFVTMAMGDILLTNTC